MCGSPAVNNDHITVNLPSRIGLTNGMIKRRGLGIDGLPVDHARVIHEHHGLPSSVNGDRIEAITADQSADLLKGRPFVEDAFGAVRADEAMLLGHRNLIVLPPHSVPR